VTEPTDPIEPSDDAPSLTSAEEAALTEAIVCAFRPAELDPDVNEALIESCLEDPLRAATEEERVESERFRRALEGHGQHPDLDLVRGLLEAHGPGRAESGSLAGANERALERALGAASQTAATPSKRGQGNVVFVSFGVLTALAAAAAVLLVVFFPSAERGPTAAVPAGVPAAARAPAPRLTQSRSSEALFDAKFERDHTTERVDRIASVRARELRQNRFQQWGVPGP